MKITHTHTMQGTLLVIIDNKYTYEVSRTNWSSHLQIKRDTDARLLSPKQEVELKKLYWNSDASKY